MDKEALYAAVWTTVGVLGAKLIDRVFRHKKIELDDAAKLRRELHLELDSMNKRIVALSVELDHWKGKYYALVEENIELKRECADLRASVEELQHNDPQVTR